MMFAYSEDGQHFLGFRTNAVGRMQIVYDYEGKIHQIYDVETPNVKTKVISTAITNAVKHRMVVPTLFATLSSQNISLKELV